MALEIHAGLKDKLKKALTKVLPDFMFNDRWLQHPSRIRILREIGAVLPDHGTLIEKLEQYVGEEPLFNFIFSFLREEFYAGIGQDPEKHSLFVKDLSGFYSSDEIVSRLISAVVSLPWKFSVMLQLPDDMNRLLTLIPPPYGINTEIRLLSAEEAHGVAFPLTSGDAVMDHAIYYDQSYRKIIKPKWRPKTIYLAMRVNGYISGPLIDKETPPIYEAIFNVKSFIGLGVAINLFYLRDIYAQSLKRSDSRYEKLIVHRLYHEHWNLWSTLPLPWEITNTISRLTLDEFDGLKVRHGGVKKLPHHIQTIIKSDNLPLKIRNRFEKITAAFQSRPTSNSLLLASQWYLDSLIEENELLAFIQATVAIEILLGEGDKKEISTMSLTALLSNRCAYLIGKSYKERKEILSRFSKIYDVRSKIVHRGNIRLKPDERSMLKELRDLSARIICAELELLVADRNKDM